MQVPWGYREFNFEEHRYVKGFGGIKSYQDYHFSIRLTPRYFSWKFRQDFVLTPPQLQLLDGVHRVLC